MSKNTDIFEKVEDAIVDNIAIKQIANKGLVFIRERTQKGKYIKGGSVVTHNYSSKPFAAPVGTWGKMMMEKLFVAAENNPEEFKLYKSKVTGGLWVVVMGGYKKVREMAGKADGAVNMHWSGGGSGMMGSLQILPGGNNYKQQLGFTNNETAEIAYYQNVAGAGKSKKKKVFMDFSDEEKKKLATIGGKEIVKSLLKALG